MATTRRQSQPQGTDQVRREYVKAALTGIYASLGAAILDLPDDEYRAALAKVRRVSFDQADEMLKEPA